MGRPIPRSLRALAAAVVLLPVACTGASSSGSTTTAPATSASPASPSASSAGPLAAGSGPVVIEPPTGGSFLIRGSYPRTPSHCKHHVAPKLVARYPGELKITRANDGTLGITLTLPFERYLEGLAEVPPTWPAAALEAQAIAARSYALAETGWHGPEGATLPTPICASTSCQVYGGIPVPPEPGIQRWYAAVRRTAGHVLLDGSRPADTVYFSTSNGHTYGNDQVFGSAPLPYLRPVPERDDGASPESHWRVKLPFADLTRFLDAAGDWPAGPPIASARVAGDTIALSAGGASRSLGVDTVRDDVNAWAECLESGRYPSASWKGTQLPTTIPSGWLTVRATPTALVVRGRGWGHGVGMVQWGAYGKAVRGLSAAQILAYYYGGLRPEPFPEPGTIHVVVASGLTAVRILSSAGGTTVDGQEIAGASLLVTGGSAITVTSRP